MQIEKEVTQRERRRDAGEVVKLSMTEVFRYRTLCLELAHYATKSIATSITITSDRLRRTISPRSHQRCNFLLHATLLQSINWLGEGVQSVL